MNDIAEISLRQAALVAGLGYLVAFLFSLGNRLREKLIVRGDAAATARNIMASESRFRASIATWMVVLVADVVVAWALYLLLRPVSADLSLLTAWLRLVYVAIAAAAVLKLLSVSEHLSGTDEAEALQPDQRAARAMRDLTLFNYGYKVGWVFFGLHIFGLGYLIARSDYVPVVLAILLIIASVGYLINGFSSFLSSDYANNEIMTLVFVAVPAIIAELSLTVWLLIWGG